MRGSAACSFSPSSCCLEAFKGTPEQVQTSDLQSTGSFFIKKCSAHSQKLQVFKYIATPAIVSMLVYLRKGQVRIFPGVL